MHWINQHIRALSLAFFLLFTTGAGWLALDRLNRLGQAAEHLYDHPFSLAQALLELHDHAFGIQQAMRDAALAPDPVAVARYVAIERRNRADMLTNLRMVLRLLSDTPERLEPLQGVMADWLKVQDQFYDLLGKGRTAEARALLEGPGEQVFRRQHAAMEAFMDREREHAEALVVEARQAERNAAAVSLTLALLAGLALAVTVVGLSAIGTSYRPLLRLRACLLSLADGDTDVAIPYLDRPGAVGAMARAIRSFRQSLAERAAAAAALRLSEDRLKTALAIAPMSVFNMDRNLRYTWMYNPQFPLPAEAFIGRQSRDFFEAEGAARREDLFRRVLATGQPLHEELTLQFKGHGQPKIFKQMVAPRWDAAGTIVGLTCASIDITDSVRAKQQMIAAMDQAERANTSKARFLSAASHDMRQPLQALRLYLELLDQRADNADRRVMEGALAALSSAEDLLHNYLDISLLEAGIVTPQAYAFPVGDVLMDVATECGTAAQEKGLTFRVLPSREMVHSDPALLRRALVNLVSNAVRYTDQGGVLIGCRRRGQTMRIEVWDTGVGIPEDQLAAVFEDFYQVGNLERDRRRGLGLGLSVVDRVARLLGHPVDARSRVGKGSMFALTLPLRPESAGTEVLDAA